MTEEEAIKLIRSGGKAKDAGIKALYQGIARHMLRFFVFRGLSSDAANDVLQETMVKIVRGAAGFSGEGTAKAWIWQIARNSLLDHLRKQFTLRDREVIFDDEDREQMEKAGPAPAGNGIAVDECVSAGIDDFGKQMPDRAYVLTLQMDGISIADIGEQIGRSTAATKEYLSQCRKKLEPFVAHCVDLLCA